MGKIKLAPSDALGMIVFLVRIRYLNLLSSFVSADAAKSLAKYVAPSTHHETETPNREKASTTYV
jgi:hypothetical protein